VARRFAIIRGENFPQPLVSSKILRQAEPDNPGGRRRLKLAKVIPRLSDTATRW
jgi:hypothetical protein